MLGQKCYGGVRLFPERTGPCLKNVERLDFGALPMIHRMAQRGLQVDLTHFAKMDVELTRDMERVTEDIRKLTGHYINPGSGDQVADLLFKKLGLKQAKIKMTSSGDRESAADEVLTAIQHEHPVVGKVLEYKEYEKLRGTYVRPMPKLAARTSHGVWRMYPNLKVSRVTSGRLACSDPNLLAMPTRTERGRDIRKGFITDPGWCYLSVDESQIEVRIAAHRSKDTNLCNVYRQQEDVYSDFATSAFRLQDKRYKDETGHWKYPTVDKMEHRRPSKTCVLAAIYDVTAGGLQEQMPIICATCSKPALEHDCARFKPLWIETKCETLLNAFYMRYSGLMRMRLDDHAYMRRHGYMVDCWGRLLHGQAVRSVLQWVVSGALREGANHPMQAGAQGTIKLTMAAVDDDFESAGLYGDVCWPLLQVHDELLFEVREDMAEELGEMVKYRFETCAKLEVPIEASAVTAESWGTLPK